MQYAFQAKEQGPKISTEGTGQTGAQRVGGWKQGLLHLEPLSLVAPNPKCPSADLQESLDTGGFFSSFFLTHQAILISTQGYIHCLFSLFLLLIIIVSH